jgi:hypothetical protein
MKQIILINCFFLILLISCGKQKEFKSEGNITGLDISMCACCGGWYIEIENNTYRFFDLPKGSGLDLANETLPVTVKLDWVEMNGCIGDEIEVSKLMKK